MRVLRQVLRPAPYLTVSPASQILWCGAAGALAICDNNLGSHMSLHGALQKLQGRFAVPGLGDHDFQNFTLMGNGTPKVMRYAVNLHKDLIKVPAPVIATAHLIHPLDPQFCSKHLCKPVPPVAHRFVAVSILRSCRWASTWRRDGENQVQSITAVHMIRRVVLRQKKGNDW